MSLCVGDLCLPRGRPSPCRRYSYSCFIFQTEVDLDKWLTKVDTSSTLHCANLFLNGNEHHEDSDLENIFVYQVK